MSEKTATQALFDYRRELERAEQVLFSVRNAVKELIAAKEAGRKTLPVSVDTGGRDKFHVALHTEFLLATAEARLKKAQRHLVALAAKNPLAGIAP